MERKQPNKSRKQTARKSTTPIPDWLIDRMHQNVSLENRTGQSSPKVFKPRVFNFHQLDSSDLAHQSNPTQFDDAFDDKMQVDGQEKPADNQKSGRSDDK